MNLPGEPQKTELDFRIHHRRKFIIWLGVFEKISFDLEAQPLKCIEILLDITAQKK